MANQLTLRYPTNELLLLFRSSTRTCITMSAANPSTTNQSSDKMATQQPFDNTPRRRVLGDVSPNMKAISTTPAFLKKAPASSPLKRSFTASMEGGEGFTYLKKRKLTDKETLSQINAVPEHVARYESGQSFVQSAGFRPIFQPTSIKIVSGLLRLHPLV